MPTKVVCQAKFVCQFCPSTCFTLTRITITPIKSSCICIMTLLTNITRLFNFKNNEKYCRRQLIISFHLRHKMNSFVSDYQVMTGGRVGKELEFWETDPSASGRCWRSLSYPSFTQRTRNLSRSFLFQTEVVKGLQEGQLILNLLNYSSSSFILQLIEILLSGFLQISYHKNKHRSKTDKKTLFSSMISELSKKLMKF